MHGHTEHGAGVLHCMIRISARDVELALQNIKACVNGEWSRPCGLNPTRSQGSRKIADLATQALLDLAGLLGFVRWLGCAATHVRSNCGVEKKATARCEHEKKRDAVARCNECNTLSRAPEKFGVPTLRN